GGLEERKVKKVLHAQTVTSSIFWRPAPPRPRGGPTAGGDARPATCERPGFDSLRIGRVTTTRGARVNEHGLRAAGTGPTRAAADRYRPGPLSAGSLFRSSGQHLAGRHPDLSLLHPDQVQRPLARRLGPLQRRSREDADRRLQEAVGDELSRQPVDRIV